jgi:NitT/TauT family transport system substrate-binding protein
MRLPRILAVWLAVGLCAACATPAPSAPAPPSGAAPTARPDLRGEPSAPAAPAAQPPDLIRIGYPSRSVTFLTMLLARDQGYYEQQGLNAELIQVRPSVGVTALLNGDVDYTESLGSNVRSALQGAPVKTVMISLRAPLFSLVARPELRAPSDLHGRTVGITSYGGSIDQTARLVLKHYGLEPQRDVQIVPLGDAPVQYEVLKLGQVDSSSSPSRSRCSRARRASMSW